MGEECQTLLDNILSGYYIPAMLALATTHVVAQLYIPYDLLYLELVANISSTYYVVFAYPSQGSL